MAQTKLLKASSSAQLPGNIAPLSQDGSLQGKISLAMQGKEPIWTDAFPVQDASMPLKLLETELSKA